MSTAFPKAHFRHTAATAVVPFYLYAAFSFLISAVLLLVNSPDFREHYFHPHTLALTHLMALGWATMVILGASHQLVPVLTERPLHSMRLAQLSFILAALGIPLLVYGFYVFDMGWPAKWGGRLILLSVLAYLINLLKSTGRGRAMNVHAVFIITAAGWLFLTAFLGLTLVYNFTYAFLPKETLVYLPLHAHAGILGWFLLLVTGVGSRLIPMFLISKYQNNRLLWVIYAGINGGLLLYLLSFFMAPGLPFIYPGTLILLSFGLFVFYLSGVFRARIRKQVDEPMKVSLLSVAMMLLPIVILLLLAVWKYTGTAHARYALLYGFVIFFGWITAIILGMTFKTLPFIIWNRLYHDKAGRVKTPNPKDLYAGSLFNAMAITYLAGFLCAGAGIFGAEWLLLKMGAGLLLLSAILYNLNVWKTCLHKPVV
ncbi:MAG: cytochrome C oxidase subunit I [Sphingobacteriales bacterium]|nr:cytochrome C oxidase subunit I [Sphingobacteriales bacterium]